MDHTRHSSIFDISHLSITLIGAGGIGAITALTLAKMGTRDMIIYDMDTVSEENMATQLHKIEELNSPKVFAVTRILKEFSDDIEVYPMWEGVTKDTELQSHVVISAVDSISARHEIWQAVKNGPVAWYIDARMGAEELQINFVDMIDEDSIEAYENMLMAESDDNVIEAPCTAKATFYCAALSGAIIGRTVRQLAMGIQPKRRFVQNLVSDFLFTVSS